MSNELLIAIDLAGDPLAVTVDLSGEPLSITLDFPEFESSATPEVGQPMGLLLALTYAE